MNRVLLIILASFTLAFLLNLCKGEPEEVPPRQVKKQWLEYRIHSDEKILMRYYQEKFYVRTLI